MHRWLQPISVLALVVLLAGISACGAAATVLPTGVPPPAAVPTTEAASLPPTVPASTAAVSIAAASLIGPINLPRLVIAAIPDDLPKYNRSNWDHRWTDADGDCQDTRAEVLIAESAVAVSFGIDGRCTVDGGQWLTPFTGTAVEFSRLLDIGHTVPLANAHRSGAREWSPQRKQDYFNDLSFDGHLIAVALSVTRSRGASGPEGWQPPDAGYQCEYAVNWIKVKAAWALTATADEWTALEKMLATCTVDVTIEKASPVTIAGTTPGSALPTATPSQLSSPTPPPTPTPTPVQEPTPTPLPTPTPTLTPAPTPTPTPAPATPTTPTQTPTATPAPTPTPAPMTKQEVEALARLRVDGLVGADLSGIDLSGASLPSANLFSTDLSGSNLSEANLVGAALPRADLSGADLSNADLRFADLNGANLSGANLTGADLTKAILSQADLSQADLSEAFLLRANLSNANLAGANLARTDWNNAFCRDPGVFPDPWCTLAELQAAGALAALTSPPHVFSGTALINNAAAPQRTTVTATISNIEVASTIVTTDGAYKFRIHEPPDQNFTGKEITFKVGGFTASSTAEWEAGGDYVLNLFAPSR